MSAERFCEDCSSFGGVSAHGKNRRHEVEKTLWVSGGLIEPYSKLAEPKA